MLTWRASWWMYVVAAVYALTFLFNTRQEFWGPASEGWVLSGGFKASSVLPGGPMDKAGLRSGDVLEVVGGQPLNGAADWFLARAHFERDHPVEIQVRRSEQHLALKLVIAAPVWRTWNRTDYLPAVALYVARFVLLLLAILVGFSLPQQLSARLAALMFAIGAVAEGYPSSGWAAALRHLPALLAVPIGFATASCLLAPVVWLAFFASFPSTSAFATVAMGAGNRASGTFWSADRGLSDRNDLRTIRLGQTLGGGAFGGPSALDTRCCRCHPPTVSQRVAAVSADHEDQIVGGMARGYDYLFCGRLPDASGRLSPP